MVALQHGRVVVEDGQLAARVAQEGVGPARVVHVVDRGGYQRRHLVQLVQAALKGQQKPNGVLSIIVRNFINMEIKF